MEVAPPNSQLPPIPSKRYFTIGEVSDLCGVKTHVLRYWEGEFPSLKPMKRRGNRRYYQREDVLLIRQIRALLYEQGYTISGARQKLLDEAHTPPPTVQPLEPIVVNGNDVAPLVEELERILFILKY
jgi:DNA-binding transcriptional MerR regulator